MSYYEFSKLNEIDENNPDIVMDLHGYTTFEAEDILNDFLFQGKYKFIRIIVGKGGNSENGPVLREFVKSYLNKNKINYNYANYRNGGEGALDVFLK